MRKNILITGFMSLLLLSAIFSTQTVQTVCNPIKTEDQLEWPMFRHDLRHTGYTDDLGPNNNQTRWKYSTRWADVISSPAVVGNRVYVGSWDDNLYCFDVFTGRVVWKYATGGWIESSPAVADGRVYVGSWDNRLYCLNASNGDLIWNYTTGDKVVSSPAVSEGRVYVGSKDSFVYCLNASTGKLIWNYTTGLFVKSSPAVAYGSVYISSADDYLYCLDAYNGSQKWNYTPPFGQVVIGENFYSSPTVVNGKVYIGSWSKYMYCLDAYNGSPIWNFTAGDWIESSPAVADGKVYVGSWNNNFYCLNASTGTLIWNYTTGDSVDSSPAVAGGMVYVGSEDKNVYCFNASTGDLIWKYETDGAVDSSPAVAEGAVYIGNDDGYVYCFGFKFLNVFSVLWGVETYYVETFSNSTVAEFNFNQEEMQISFNANSSTPSFCNVTIPKQLLNATQNDWLIRVDNETISYEVTENGTHSFLYFTYYEGTHIVEIVGTWVVSDFPLSMTVPLLLIVTLIAVALAKRMRGSARGFSM